MVMLHEFEHLPSFWRMSAFGADIGRPFGVPMQQSEAS
jgi:hypothetical protein